MISSVIAEADELFVRQKKEWTEIVIDFETRNQYAVLDKDGESVGTISEISAGVGGFLKRTFFGSHRALDIRVHDSEGEPAFRFSRPFFFLFSTLAVAEEGGAPVGRVNRRFGVLYKKYDLLDAHGRCFAEIRGPRWRIWTFPVKHSNGVSQASISKKWGGALREIFADADTFRIAFEEGIWTPSERSVVFAAAFSIDFDFFENNQGSGGLLSFVD